MQNYTPVFNTGPMAFETEYATNGIIFLFLITLIILLSVIYNMVQGWIIIKNRYHTSTTATEPATATSSPKRAQSTSKHMNAEFAAYIHHSVLKCMHTQSKCCSTLTGMLLQK